MIDGQKICGKRVRQFGRKVRVRHNIKSLKYQKQSTLQS